MAARDEGTPPFRKKRERMGHPGFEVVRTAGLSTTPSTRFAHSGSGRDDRFSGGLFGAPEGVEGEGGPEADGRVGDGDAGEDEDAEAGQGDEGGVEAGAGAAEGAAGEGFDEEGEREDGEGEGQARGHGESVWSSCPKELGGFHAGGHRPVEERRLFEVADAVGVEGDVVVAEQHLAGDFGVDGVGVVEQWRGEQREAGIERHPEHEHGKQRGARSRGVRKALGSQCSCPFGGKMLRSSPPPRLGGRKVPAFGRDDKVCGCRFAGQMTFRPMGVQ